VAINVFVFVAVLNFYAALSGKILLAFGFNQERKLHVLST